MYKIIDFTDAQPCFRRRVKVSTKSFTIMLGYLVEETGGRIYKIPRTYGVSVNHDLIFCITHEGVLCDVL